MEFTTTLLELEFVGIVLCAMWTLHNVQGACVPECKRGLCLNVSGESGSTDVCECGVFYEGPTCGSVNLDRPTKEIGPTYIQFSWDRNLYSGNIPNLTSFVFLIYLRDSANVRRNYKIKEPTGDIANAAQVTVPALTSGSVAYVICLIHNSTDLGNLTDSAFAHLTHETRKSCLSFRTGHDENDPYTESAIWVACAMSIVLLLIFMAGVIFECTKNSVGKKIRRSLRSSWRHVFLDRYAESKQRVARSQQAKETERKDYYNSGFTGAVSHSPKSVDSRNNVFY